MKNRLLIFTFFSLLFCSCEETATLFLPNAIPFDLMTEKGSGRISAGAKATDNGIVSAELQTAYLPLKKLTVLGNFSYYNKSINDFEFRRQYFGELGIGTHFKKDYNENLVSIFELSGGFGWGDATDFRQNTFTEGGFSTLVEDRFYAKSARQYAQLNWGLRFVNPKGFKLQFGPSLRISNVNVYNIYHESSQRTLDIISPKFQTFDAGHNLNIGKENINFMLQIMMTAPFPGPSDDVFDEYVDANEGRLSVILGLNYDF